MRGGRTWVWVSWIAAVVGWGSVEGEVWTLERALRFARENSPDARAAQYRIAAAEAVLRQARSAFWPQLQAVSSYVRTDNPMLAFGSVLNQQAFQPTLNFNDVPDADNLNIHGQVTLPLYTGGRIRGGEAAARAGAAAARSAAEAVRNTLDYEIVHTFLTIQKTREFIRATEAAVAAFEGNLAVAQRRFNAGTALKHEVLDVEVRVSQAREDLVRARNANALSLEALGNLLGLERGPVEVAEENLELEEPAAGVAADRPELLAAREMALAAEAEVKRARAGYYPQVGAFGRYDYDRGWEFDGSGDSYTVGVQAEWDIWNGRRTRAQTEEARARLEVAREQERKLRLAVNLEIEQARLALEESNRRLEVTETVVRQAAESAEITRTRFEQGLALSTQLIDAETVLTAARVRRAEAEGDRKIALAALRRALGLPQTTHSVTNP